MADHHAAELVLCPGRAPCSGGHRLPRGPRALAQREPLDGAVVNVGGPSLQGTRAATTDASGRFAFLWLPPGTYVLDVRRLGFAAARLRHVTVRLGGRTSVGDVALAPQAVEVRRSRCLRLGRHSTR